MPKHSKVAPTTVDPIEAATLQVGQREADLIAARARVIELETGVKQARASVADAIHNWQAQFPIKSRSELARDFIASELAQRRRIARGEMEEAQQPRPGNSQIDRLAAAGRGGIGYGHGFRRGSLPASSKGLRIRLPSDR